MATRPAPPAPTGRLQQYLKEHPEHGFLLRKRGANDPGRLVLTFPYGTGIKNDIDKNHRNFDYKINSLFNGRLRDAMQVVVYFNALFPEATEMAKRLVVEEMKKNEQRTTVAAKKQKPASCLTADHLFLVHPAAAW